MAWCLIGLSLLMPALVLIEDDRSILATMAVLFSPIVLVLGLRLRSAPGPDPARSVLRESGRSQRRSDRQPISID
jgi:hypothetical protein